MTYQSIKKKKIEKKQFNDKNLLLFRRELQ